MGDRKHHDRPREQSSAADDLGLGLPTELPAPEVQEAPGLKRHGDPLQASIESDWRPGENPGSEESVEHDPTAQADGDDGNPESGARGRRELGDTRRGS